MITVNRNLVNISLVQALLAGGADVYVTNTVGAPAEWVKICDHDVLGRNPSG